jgi:hypothetical protein
MRGQLEVRHHDSFTELATREARQLLQALGKDTAGSYLIEQARLAEARLRDRIETGSR